MCRVELPPGPEQLDEEATRRYFEVHRRVDRGDASWGALTKAQQREMDIVVGMWRNAADQGHADAQHRLGLLYVFGRGVKIDSTEAARWFRKAAEQGNAKAQFNLGQKNKEWVRGETMPKPCGGIERRLSKDTPTRSSTLLSCTKVVKV